jgi:hypothetical protein
MNAVHSLRFPVRSFTLISCQLLMFVGLLSFVMVPFVMLGVHFGQRSSSIAFVTCGMFVACILISFFVPLIVVAFFGLLDIPVSFFKPGKWSGSAWRTAKFTPMVRGDYSESQSHKWFGLAFLVARFRSLLVGLLATEDYDVYFAVVGEHETYIYKINQHYSSLPKTPHLA